MKTLKNGWYGLLVAALPFLVSGCLKSDNHVTFTISTGGYVLQNSKKELLCMLLIYTVFLLRKLQVQNWNVRKIRIVLMLKKQLMYGKLRSSISHKFPMERMRSGQQIWRGRLLLKNRRLRLTRAWEN